MMLSNLIELAELGGGFPDLFYSTSRIIRLDALTIFRQKENYMEVYQLGTEWLASQLLVLVALHTKAAEPLLNLGSTYSGMGATGYCLFAMFFAFVPKDASQGVFIVSGTSQLCFEFRSQRRTKCRVAGPLSWYGSRACRTLQLLINIMSPFCVGNRICCAAAVSCTNAKASSCAGSRSGILPSTMVG
ncbi:hypothetical protein RRF57_008533 [Xylaria bambusicola]|uniref:Uncharacterized protein n=1 Tax=Xylaria bambusicola TaxID=326684 RepID=A0AAN7UY70_9PEZI